MRKVINLGGDKKGDYLRDAGLKINENFDECFTNIDRLLGIIQTNAPTASRWETPRVLLLQGDVTGSVRIDGSTNILIGTTVAGTAVSTANALVRRDPNGGFSAGSVSASQISTESSGLCERYRADAPYGIGTVVVFGGAWEITTTETLGDSRVAGVVTIDPAVTLNASRGADTTHPRVTVLGRTQCKVLGPVAKGDMLVTSTTPGFAQAVKDAGVGTVIGKALQEFEGRSGMIEVSVSPQ
jgi:hypothetical protein